MKKKLIIYIVLVSFCFSSRMQAQGFNPFYQSVVDSVSFDTILKNLQSYQSFGLKNATSQGIHDTRNWLLTQYHNYGYPEVALDSFMQYNIYQYSVIVTKYGVLYPDTYIIVDGHYDTDTGPGVDDNGSGTCAILEMARILKNVPTEYSIKFINFTMEEGYAVSGSQHYINNIVIPQDLDIRLLLNIDMIGGVAGLANDSIECEADTLPPYENNTPSAAYTDSLMNLVELYSPLKAFYGGAYGSDYFPFQQEGYVITGLFEQNFSPYWHTLADTLGNIDTSYIFNATRAATGATLYFSHAYNSTEINENEINHMNTLIYPNPAADDLIVNAPDNSRIDIININGQIIRTLMHDNGQLSVDIAYLQRGVYIVRVISDNEVLIGKIIKE